jgi:hypothetical protein|tara:strand:- start:48 stop:299 length:252 start_codon:yes stop_codon:yes gene_type:complete
MVKETLMLLATQVEERRKDLLEAMGRGTDKFEAYLSAVGEARGYMIIQSMIVDAIKTHEEGDEDFGANPTDSVVKIDSKKGKK